MNSSASVKNRTPILLKVLIHVVIVIAIVLAVPLVYDAVSQSHSALQYQRWARGSGLIGIFAYPWYWILRIPRPRVKFVCGLVFAVVTVNLGNLYLVDLASLEASIYVPIASLVLLLSIAIVSRMVRRRTQALLYFYTFLILLAPGLALQFEFSLMNALKSMGSG